GILELMKEQGMKAEDIAKIEVYHDPAATHKSRGKEAMWNPQTAPECQFSLPYVVATAAYDGDVSLDSYTPEAITRQRVRDLMTKISIKEAPDLPRHAARIRMILKDGGEYSKECIYPKGHPNNPLTDSELIDKLKKCVGYSAYQLNEVVVDSLISALMNLDKVDDVEANLLVPLTPK
ncbi:MmgE/PrpD family protein, partial [Chloroflexota bacterium]